MTQRDDGFLSILNHCEVMSNGRKTLQKRLGQRRQNGTKHKVRSRCYWDVSGWLSKEVRMVRADRPGQKALLDVAYWCCSVLMLQMQWWQEQKTADQNYSVILVKDQGVRERWRFGQVPPVCPDAVCMGNWEQADPVDCLARQVLFHDAWHDVGNMAKRANHLML